MADCKSFLPIIDYKSKILILGSMPGIKSLEMQQYYAHPQNRFWKLIGKLCACNDLQLLDYDKKIQILLKNNFALWDVLNFCKREGSLDTNIQNEIPNKIPELLKEYPNIKIILLNGHKAFTAFKKYFPQLLTQYYCYKMPSTSPANAKSSTDDLFREWNHAINHIN